jgi:transposase InsO family protein
LVRRHPRFGYRRIHALLRRDGWRINRKRVHRLWKLKGYKVPKKTVKRRRLGISDNGVQRRRATHINDVWCWDFVHDRDERGLPLKWLVIEDEFTREGLALEVARSIKAEDVLDVLSQLMLIRGAPNHIRSDNGPEFIANAIRTFLKQANVSTLYIEPGAPWQNAYAESFNSRLRDELLNMEMFADVREARSLAEWWRSEYNHRRPHSSLDYATPAEFAKMMETDAAGCSGSGSHADAQSGAAPRPSAQHAMEEESTLTRAGT